VLQLEEWTKPVPKDDHVPVRRPPGCDRRVPGHPEQGLVKKPDNISFEQAGAVNIAAKTTVQALRDAGNSSPGRRC
jgi:NADPH:quinone reductase-like Zn-dependent oxidoreductase